MFAFPFILMADTIGKWRSRKDTVGFVLTEIFDRKIFAQQNQLTVVNSSQPLTSYSVYMTV